MTRSVLVFAAILSIGPTAAFAACADDIKAYEDQAAGRDAAVKPGAQTGSGGQAAAPSEGGGAASASAKILEAKAHAGKGDEAACRKALDEAKAMVK